MDDAVLKLFSEDDRRFSIGPSAIPGAGLGLWIASTFITANGGTLDAESAGSGLGTTMTIRLPVTPHDGHDGVEEVA